MNLSLVEQSPRLRTLYTQLCFCYGVDYDIPLQTVVETLTNGLEQLTAAFPWLAGQVVNEGVREDDSGIFKIASFERLSRLVVKDFKHDSSFTTMQTLRDSKFPYSMLDEKLLCPRSTLSDGPSETSSDPFPVLLLQANFIAGGFLLTVLASHITMDIVGQSQVIRLLSRACHGSPFTAEEITNGNLDRRNLIPLLDDFEALSSKPADPKPKVTVSQSTSNVSSTPPIPTFSWAYFTFKSTSLALLKAAATSTMMSSSQFVSTDDCISALIWQSIVRVRLARLSPSTPSTFIRQVDMRKHMDIAPTYIGNMVTQTTLNTTLQELTDKPLGAITSQLRSALDPETLKYNMRVHATSQARTKDKSAGPAKDRSQTITMSSWSKIDCSNLDFNLGLGQPECVRRPRFTPIEGIVYLLPKAPDGEIAAGLCLRAEDMEALKRDEKFMKYAEYVG